MISFGFPTNIIRRNSDGKLFTTWLPDDYGERDAMVSLFSGEHAWSFREIRKRWIGWRYGPEKWRIVLTPDELRKRRYDTGFKVIKS